jgi:hypothetical protein
MANYRACRDRLRTRLLPAIEKAIENAVGSGDPVRHGGSGPDPRELPPRGLQARNFYDPYGHIDEIKVKTRDFR